MRVRILTSTYAKLEPERSTIDALEGPAVLEFGTPWCGHCKAAQPLLATVLAAQPLLTHIKIQDGKGRPLGRSFRVTLWPTLIFLKDGREVARLVRPMDETSIKEAVAQIG